LLFKREYDTFKKLSGLGRFFFWGLLAFGFRRTGAGRAGRLYGKWVSARFFWVLMAKTKKKTGRASVNKAGLKTFLARVIQVVEPILAGMGLELVLAQAPLVGGRPVIRLFIDRRPGPDAVSLDDCAAVSRALEATLETEEAEAPDGYVLEISSPGLDRPLLKSEDCRRFQGRLARLKLRRFEGQRIFRGRLALSEVGGLALLTENGLMAFAWEEVISGRLVLEEPGAPADGRFGPFS
jgi:ribosome maturation factor RimP